MRSILLYSGFDYKVFVPEIDFFVKKIQNGQYFSIIKYSIEYWMMVAKAFNNLGISPRQMSSYFLEPNNNIGKIAQEMCKIWELKQRANRPWKSDVNVVHKTLMGLKQTYPDNLMFGLSLFNLYIPINHDKAGVRDVVINLMSATKKEAYWTYCWREWAYNGKINTLITAANSVPNLKIVIVGSHYFKNFGQKLGLHNFDHIEIHPHNAALYVKDTKKEILNRHSKYIKENNNVLYLLVGGSIAMCLILELHNLLSSAFMIDIGRALDVYYYYDCNSEKYAHKGWLLTCEPKWVKTVLPNNIKGIAHKA